MPGLKLQSLNLLVLTDEPERFRGGLLLALTARALCREVSMFLQLDAVGLLGSQAPRDGAHQTAGLPSLAEMIEEALASGVIITACQTGLHLTGRNADTLDPRIRTGGLLSFLAAIEPEDQLLAI